MAVRYKTKSGKTITLLNPSERSRKFASELKSKVRHTNDGEIKKDKSGKKLTLSNTQKSFRAGYLLARKDNAKCYNAKHKKK